MWCRGGEKICPLEVDEVLLNHPSIKEAVTFGAPDDKYGEIVCCAIVLHESHQLTSDTVKKFCLEHVASFKVPERIFFVDTLPRTPTGKVQRRHVASSLL